MILRYTNTIDDVSAFYQFHTARSPTYRRSLRWGALTIVALVVFVTAVLFPPEGQREKVVWIGVFLAFFLLFYPREAARSLARASRSAAAEGPNSCVVCEHELEIAPTGLLERTPVSESRLDWTAIPGVVETPGHVFVYTQANFAHVIPRNAVSAGELAAFPAAIRERLPTRPS